MDPEPPNRPPTTLNGFETVPLIDLSSRIILLVRVTAVFLSSTGLSNQDCDPSPWMHLVTLGISFSMLNLLLPVPS